MAPTEISPPMMASSLSRRRSSALQVQQHDHEEEEHHDGARIDQHLHRGEEVGVEQDKQAGQGNDGQDQKHRAGDRDCG